MNENQKAFIQRHIKQLIEKDYLPEKALQQSLVVLDDKELSSNIMSTYAKSGSLSKTLHTFKIIDIDSHVVNQLEILERADSEGKVAIEKLIETNETISDIFALLKVKLSVGLGYALWLSVFATFVFTLVNTKILPQFRELFEGFGAELPAFTKMALSWQDSFFSPVIVGVLFVLIVGYLLVSIHKLPTNKIIAGQTLQSKLIAKLPFIKSIIEFTQTVQWLSYLNVLATAGLSVNQCFDKLAKFPEQTEYFLPELSANLNAADKIGNLTSEIDFQSKQLELKAEELVAQASRKLVATVMVFVVIFVVFTIFACYLPIFQLGAVV